MTSIVIIARISVFSCDFHDKPFLTFHYFIDRANVARGSGKKGGVRFLCVRVMCNSPNNNLRRKKEKIKHFILKDKQNIKL